MNRRRGDGAAAGLFLAAVLLAQEGAASPAALRRHPSIPAAASGIPAAALPGQAEAGEVAPEVVAELRELFERLELGLRWGDGAVLRDCLDLDAMLREAFEQGQRDLPAAPRQAVLKEEFLTRIAEESYPWTLWGLGRIEPRGPGEYTVCTWYSAGEEVYGYYRWQVRRGEGWRITGFEDVASGFTAVDELRGDAAELSGPAHDFVRHLFDCHYALEYGTLEEAEASLAAMRGLELDASQDACRLLMESTVRQWDGRPSAALRSLKGVEALGGDVPGVHLHRALALNDLGRYAEALPEIERFTAAVAETAETHWIRGEALAGLERPAEAQAAYAAGLKADPDYLSDFVGWVSVATDAQLDEAAQRFQALEDPVGSFEFVAEGLLETGALRVLKRLIREFRELAPGDPDAAYYEAEILYWNGQPERVVETLRPVLDAVDELDLPYYLDLFLWACLELEVPLQGYRDAPDRTYALQYLAEELLYSDDLETLAALLEVHGEAAPGDVWLRYYRGELAAARGDTAAALAELEEGYTESVAEEELDAFHAALLDLWYELGKPLEALERVPPRELTYEALVDLAVWEDDAELLAQLLEVRRGAAAESEPPAPELVGYLAYLRRDHETAFATLARCVPGQDSRSGRLPALERALVIAALRSDRSAEALRFAQASTERDGDPFLLALCHALGGDVAQASALLRECLALGYEGGDFYGDPELGPVLRGEAFAAFRRELPP